MKLDEDFFDKYEYQIVEFEGEKYEFPVKYYDLQRIAAFFPASARKLKKYLPSKKLKLYQPFPGISLILIIAFKYRKLSNIEPYNEVGIGFPVVLKTNKQKYTGSYVIHLPVSTEDSCKGGIEFWGYPKFVADITFEETDKALTCFLRHENQDILEFRVNKLETEALSEDSNSFTVKENKLLRSIIRTQGFSGKSREKGGATLTLGEHPISKEIEPLFRKTKSVLHAYEPKIQLILPLAEEEYDL